MFIFFKGIIIGFSIAAPVGPIGLLCMQRTLSKGKLSGFVSGLGAATADAFYGIIAALGLTFISNFLISQQAYLKVIGSLFLIYLGIDIFLKRNQENKEIIDRNTEKNLLKDYLSTFLLTIVNPVTVLAFLAIFTSLNLSQSSSTIFFPLILVSGVFLGSLFWWFILSYFVSLFRNKFNLNYINIFSSFVIIAFGLFALYF